MFFRFAVALSWLPILAAPIVGYLLFGEPGAVWPLLALAVNAVIVLPIIFSRGRVPARLQADVGPLARKQTQAAVEAAGSAGVVINAALCAADGSLERARRAGGMARGQTLSVRLQARSGFTRTGDEVGDAARALTLATESERVADSNRELDESFNERLRANGHRFS